MPTVKVERLRNDGPFQVGATYGVAAGATDEHFSGVIVGVTPTGPRLIAPRPCGARVRSRHAPYWTSRSGC